MSRVRLIQLHMLTVITHEQVNYPCPDRNKILKVKYSLKLFVLVLIRLFIKKWMLEILLKHLEHTKIDRISYIFTARKEG
jgi:hypothetical protein